jgi:hypothetical protein
MKVLRLTLAVVGVMLAVVAGCAAPSPTVAPRNPAALDEDQTYEPVIDPDNFSRPLANDYYPLEPGLTTVFEGGGEHVEVTVTEDTKVIMGVTTQVITDQVTVDGELTEDTVDWYAADNFGNVWYFGEKTAEYENGEITSTEGSWEAGLDGALPGIIMLAEPRVGDTYRQEFYAGEAEDVAKVYVMDERITVPKDTYDLVLVTEDWSLLTPDVHERKWYAPGIGVVFEETITGGSDTLSLIDVAGP